MWKAMKKICISAAMLVILSVFLTPSVYTAAEKPSGGDPSYIEIPLSPYDDFQTESTLSLNGIYDKAKRYNIELVVDGSASLTDEKMGTDRNGERYKALRVFLALLANKGNRVGAIVFNDKEEALLDKGELKGLSSMSEKMALADEIEEAGTEGDTDIGGALLKALDHMKVSMDDSMEVNPDYKRCILLFTDGVTEITDSTGKKDVLATNASLEKEKDAIKKAQELGIPIYCIYLDTNSAFEKKNKGQEIVYITNETGGKFWTIDNPKSLTEKYMEFFELFYDRDLESFDSEEITLKDGEPIKKEIPVFSEEIKEVNLFLEGLDDETKVAITRPDGVELMGEELAKHCCDAGDIEIIKLDNHYEGKWKVFITGTSDAKIKMRTIYDTKISLEMDELKESYGTDEEIVFRGYLCADGKRITSEAPYKDYEARLLLTQKGGDGKQYEVVMESDGPSYTYHWKGNSMSLGEYYIAMKVAFGDVSLQWPVEGSQGYPATFSIVHVNKPPEAVQESQDVVLKQVFFENVSCSIPLGEYFSDPDGDVLTFSFGISDFVADEAWISRPDKEESGDQHVGSDFSVNEQLISDVLTVSTRRNVSGEIEVIAEDSSGEQASLTFRIQIKSDRRRWIRRGVIIFLILLVFLFIRLIKSSQKNREERIKRNAKCDDIITVWGFYKEKGQEVHSQPYAPEPGFKYEKGLWDWPVDEKCGISGRFHVYPDQRLSFKSNDLKTFYCDKQETTEVFLERDKVTRIHSDDSEQQGINVLVTYR